MDLAAEQPRDLPADRKPEARAAVLSTRGAVGLLEGLENNLLLARRNPDAGVADREGHDTIRLPEPEVLARPSRQDLFDAQGDHAMLREFDGVRQQVFQHLLQTHQIGLNGRGQTRHALDRDHLASELREHRSLVPRAGADVEHLLTAPERERLADPRDHVGLRDRLAVADRQRGVVVGAIAEALRDEQLARHALHRTEDALVAHVAATQLPLDHQPAERRGIVRAPAREHARRPAARRRSGSRRPARRRRSRPAGTRARP